MKSSEAQTDAAVNDATKAPPPPPPAATLDPRAPESFRALLTLFSAFEFGLNSLALYQHTPEFPAVKLAVESSSQSQFTIDHLRQILWLLPGAYSVSWTRRKPAKGESIASLHDHEDNEPVLLIRRLRLPPSSSEKEPSPPSTESLGDRIQAFIRRLNVVLAEHIAEITADVTDFPDEDLQAALELVEIERASLPQATSSDQGAAPAQRLAALAHPHPSSTDATPTSELAEALAAPIPEDLQDLPKWLVDRVRVQEQRRRRVTERADQAQRQRLYTTLPQLSDQLQSYAIVARRRVFPMADLVRRLRAKAPLPTQVAEQLRLLESLVPFWVTIRLNDGQEYVELSRSHKYNAIKAALRRALATER